MSLGLRASTTNRELSNQRSETSPRSRSNWAETAHPHQHLLALQRTAGNRVTTSVIQRAPINFKNVGPFLALNRDRRLDKLESQTVNHLRRLVVLLEDRLSGQPSAAEEKAIRETVADISTVVEGHQGAEINNLGKGESNWANAVLYVDGRVVATVSSTKSGVSVGAKRSRWGAVGEGVSETELQISHNDSEATVFNELDPKTKGETIRSAQTSVELAFVSTNGACDGCKARINEFVNQMVLPHAGPGVRVEMRYRYRKPPKLASRGIPTTYGWMAAGSANPTKPARRALRATDQKVGEFYQHTTVYRE